MSGRQHPASYGDTAFELVIEIPIPDLKEILAIDEGVEYEF